MRKNSGTPLYEGPKLLHAFFIEKPKNENSDYVSSMVKMCSYESQTSPKDIWN